MKARDLARLLVNQEPTGPSLDLSFAGFRVRVISNVASLIDYLRSYYWGFVSDRPVAPEVTVVAWEGPPADVPVPLAAKPPDPGKTRVKEEYADLGDGRVVKKTLTHMVFVFGSQINLAYGPCAVNPNQVINFINNRYIQRRLEEGCLLLHASAVAVAGEGLVIAGFAGTGKSTLALHLMRRGFDFVSNDRVLMSEDRRAPAIYGVPKLPRINPGTALNNPALAAVLPTAKAAAYKNLSPGELWSLEDKYDVDIRQVFGAERYRTEARYAGLVVLNWRREPQAIAVRGVDLPTATYLSPSFMKSPGLFYLPGAGVSGGAGAEAYAALLATRPVFEITGGVDFEAAAEACTRLVQGKPSS